MLLAAPGEPRILCDVLFGAQLQAGGLHDGRHDGAEMTQLRTPWHPEHLITTNPTNSPFRKDLGLKRW